MLMPLDQMLAQSNLTVDRAIALIQAHTKEKHKTIHQRLRRWRMGQWPSFPTASRDLRILGWELQPLYLADMDDRVRNLKAQFRYCLGELSEAKVHVRPMLKTKMVKALGEIRELYGRGKLTPDQVDWWRQVDDVATAKWWNDRYLEQLAIAQNDPSRTSHAVYALAVYKALIKRPIS